MGVHKLQPKDHLKPSNLKGISNEQIEPHFEAHYKGYVTKYNEIQEKLEESFNYMGVVLHELYFGHLGAKGQPSEAFKKKVEL
jgi:Fe-Mn family superoxide dismutase